MRPTKYEKFQDFILIFIRRIAYIFELINVRTKYQLSEGLTFKRKEPYVMIANHTFMFDVIHVPLRFKKPPFVVASQTLFSKQPTKFLLSKVAHAIPKSKGSSDIRTAKMLLSSVKKGYPILIFPEGDTTFQGDTNYIEESTYKLIKKLKVDVIICKVSGGYLSKPRWATGKRKNRKAFLDYKLVIKKEDLKKISVEEIAEVCKKEMYNNDYEYQRKHMIKHPGKKLAEGIENMIYVCPECEGVNTFTSNGNSLKCSSCNTEGYIDEFGFIQNFKYDNLIDWDKFQKELSYKLKDEIFETEADLFFADYETEIRSLVGKVILRYEEGHFIFTGDHNEKVPLKEIKNPIVTLRRNLNFTYQEKNYVVKLEKNVLAFLRVSQVKY